jgi:transposase-like protein
MKLKLKARLKKAHRSRNYSGGLRQATVQFARAAVASGSTLTEVALELGMKPNTLHRWHQRAAEGKPQGAIEFVEVTGVPTGDVVEVVWPTGHLVRLGGANLKSVFQALEATCCPRE